MFYQNSASATWGVTSNVTFNDGTATSSGSGTGAISPNLTGTTTDTKQWETPLCIEFDFIKGTGNCQTNFSDGTTTISRYLTTDCHVKIECSSTATLFYYDNATPISESALNGVFFFRFLIWVNSSNTIQNLKIYPM